MEDGVAAAIGAQFKDTSRAIVRVQSAVKKAVGILRKPGEAMTGGSQGFDDLVRQLRLREKRGKQQGKQRKDATDRSRDTWNEEGKPAWETVYKQIAGVIRAFGAF